MAVFEILQVVPQPAPDEYAAIVAAFRQLAASSLAVTAHAPATRLRYHDVTRESVRERPGSWPAAARLDALHV